MSPKHAGGRPQKTINNSGLPENWKDIVYELSGSGCSEVEIRAHLCLLGGKFSNDTWSALKTRDAEFSDTLKKARILCEAWWLRVGRENLEHGKERIFETALWFINMKNRFGWKDKTEIDHGITDDAYEKYKTLSVKDLETELDALMPNRVQKLLT